MVTSILLDGVAGRRTHLNNSIVATPREPALLCRLLLLLLLVICRLSSVRCVKVGKSLLMQLLVVEVDCCLLFGLGGLLGCTLVQEILEQLGVPLIRLEHEIQHISHHWNQTHLIRFKGKGLEK